MIGLQNILLLKYSEPAGGEKDQRKTLLRRPGREGAGRPAGFLK